MQAIILAGGKGTRLGPYTAVFPKPLMPIGNYPILEILINQLVKNAVTEVVIATGHLSHLIESYFGDGTNFGIKIRYSHEEKPLGTAAPLTLVEEIDENFLVMNGDLLTNIKFTDLMNKHIDEDNLLTVATFNKEVKIDLGVLEIKHNKITKYIEKPTLNYSVSMGIYAMNRSVIGHIPLNTYYDLPTLVTNLIEKNQKIGVYSFEGDWLDIGRPEDYERAQQLFAKNKSIYFKS